MSSWRLGRSLVPLTAAVVLAAAAAILVLLIGMGTDLCNTDERIWRTAGILFLGSVATGLAGLRHRTRRAEWLLASVVLVAAGLFALTIGADWTDCRNVS